MNASPSISATPPGDWLVVIDRLEASVFRSVATDALPQLIRSPWPDTGTNGSAAPRTFLNGREQSCPPGFFEPLAGVLHGARRILIFGRATTLGDATGQFITWLRGFHPDIARRVVTTALVEPPEGGQASLLALARHFFQRAEGLADESASLPAPRPSCASWPDARAAS